MRLGAPLFMRVVWASGGGAFSVCGPGVCCVRRFLRAVVGCSGYGWADNSVGVVVCCVRRFLRTAGGPVAWPVLGTVGGCCWGVLRAVGPEGLLWAGSVGVRLVGWRIFCAQVGAYFQARLGPGGVVRILCAALGLSCLL